MLAERTMYEFRPGRSVGIATGYGLDGPRIESRWERDFPSFQNSPVAHKAFYTMGIWSLLGVKRPELGVYQHLPSGAEVKERAELYLYFLMGLRGQF